MTAYEQMKADRIARRVKENDAIDNGQAPWQLAQPKADPFFNDQNIAWLKHRAEVLGGMSFS